MRQPFYWIKTTTPTGLKKEYARILPDIRQAARKRGYAIGVHGSMMRDLDLIAVPWKSRTSSQKALIKAIQLAVSHCYEKEPTIIKRPHGRIAYILKIGRKAYIDLSVMPANRDKAHNTMGIAPSPNRPLEPLVSPQCDHIVGVMPNDKPYYPKGDIRWTCSSDIKKATNEERELYEKELRKFKHCPTCGEALSG